MRACAARLARFSLLLSLGVVACGPPRPGHAPHVRSRIEGHVHNATWIEYFNDGPSYCHGPCEGCVAAAHDNVLVLSGWVTPTCDAEGVFTQARTARGRAQFAGGTHVVLVEGGDLEDIVVTDEQLEVEAPDLPHASLRATYRQRITPAGQALAADLGCAGAQPPALCERLAPTRTLEFYASYTGSVWSVVRADAGSSHSAGGLYWN